MPLAKTLKRLRKHRYHPSKAEAKAARHRQQARAAWVRDIVAQLKAANARADAAWLRVIRANPDSEDEDLPIPPEEAEVEAILAQIKAVIHHDRWPRHLHWSV
jgi:hypothetical protein